MPSVLTQTLLRIYPERLLFLRKYLSKGSVMRHLNHLQAPNRYASVAPKSQ